MRLRSAIWLAMLGGIAVLGVNNLMHMQLQPVTAIEQPMFPGISAHLADAARVEISSGDKKASLVLHDGAWGVQERDLYPADLGKLRALLVGLGELRLIEPRTTDPAQFSKLGVENPAAAGTTATLLSVRDAKDAKIAEVILGHRRSRQGNLPEEIFVRRPGQDQSFLATGLVSADTNPVAWLDRTLTDIPSSQVAAVIVQRDGNELDLSRQGETLTLKRPEGAKTDAYKLAETSRALESLTFSEVRRGALPGNPLGHAVFTVTDGTVLTVSLSRQDKKLWASLAATGNGAEAYRRLDGWSFEIPDWKERALLPSLADLAPQPEVAKPEAPNAETSPAEKPE